MQPPNRDGAFIPSEKLIGYLISESHPVGKHKARFFRALGYDEGNVDRLATDLLSVARGGEVRDAIDSPHGRKYVIDGRITVPTGSSVAVRTIWIVDAGESRPRFVTAYPSE